MTQPSRLTFDAAADLVIADVQAQFPTMTREEAFCHAVTTTELADLRKLPLPHPSQEGDEAAAIREQHRLVDAYALVIQRDHRPDHDELLGCLERLRVYDADQDLAVGCGSGTNELTLQQRVWILRARRGDLPERTPTRAQLINLVRCLSAEGVVKLSAHQRRWAQQAELGQLR